MLFFIFYCKNVSILCVFKQKLLKINIMYAKICLEKFKKVSVL